jgi:hypothetical protein
VYQIEREFEHREGYDFQEEEADTQETKQLSQPRGEQGSKVEGHGMKENRLSERGGKEETWGGRLNAAVFINFNHSARVARFQLRSGVPTERARRC